MRSSRAIVYVWGLMLVVVVCGGCGRKQAERQAERSPVPQTVTESAEAKATAEEQPPFPVTAKPPPASVPRVLIIWREDLWITNVETGEAFQVTKSKDCLEAWWSPDNQQIAYLRQGSEQCMYGPVGTIWLADAQTGQSRQLSAMREVQELAWSANGMVLAASAAHRYDDVASLTHPRTPMPTQGNEGDDSTVDAGVWLVSVATGKTQLLTHRHTGNGDIGELMHLVWGPEGELALSHSYASPYAYLGQSIQVVAGGGERIAELHDAWPCVWGGDALYFGQQAERAESGRPADGVHCLDLVDLVEHRGRSRPKRMALAKTEIYRLALSSDGQRLACWGWIGREKSLGLWVVATSTKQTRRVMALKWPFGDPPATEVPPHCEIEWSPVDDDTLACYAAPSYEHGKECGMWVLDTATEKPRRLLEVAGLSGGLAWSSDGRLLGYERVVGSDQDGEFERPVCELSVVDITTGQSRSVMRVHQCCGWAM